MLLTSFGQDTRVLASTQTSVISFSYIMSWDIAYECVRFK